MTKLKRTQEVVRDDKEVAVKKPEAKSVISSGEKIFETKSYEEHLGHLASIVESSEDAIISKSLDGIIKSWNKGGETMFGFTAADAIGKHISLIIPNEYIDEEKN